MTNTLENKAKFFAQYWGQPVMWCMGGDDYERLKYIVRSGNMRLVEKSWLELTSLSQISDEDRHEVSGDLSTSIDEYGCEYTFAGLVEWSVYDADYLRSKGYALPWMGISVNKLVEYGWVKLKGGGDE